MQTVTKKTAETTEICAEIHTETAAETCGDRYRDEGGGEICGREWR
jgi:hypothetical protein